MTEKNILNETKLYAQTLHLNTLKDDTGVSSFFLRHAIVSPVLFFSTRQSHIIH